MDLLAEAASSQTKVYGAIGAGAISYLGIFSRGEWDDKAPVLFEGTILIFLSLFAVNWAHVSFLEEAWSITFAMAIAYGATIALLMSIYRLFFHRLRTFPGPLLAGVSKLWHVSQVLDSKNHQFLLRMQCGYGDFVRTGPNEITIFNPDVLAAIDGPGTKCTKPAFYDVLLPETLVNTCREKKAHDQRRRLWNTAFAPEALSGYNKKIIKYAERLSDRVAKSLDTPANASALFYEFSFDLMGDFAFAREPSPDESLNKEWHAAIEALQTGMGLLGPLSPVPWLLHLGLRLTWIPIVRNWKEMISFCKRCMTDRVKRDAMEKSDISSWLIDGTSRQNISQDMKMRWLHGDAITMVIAGSDTVAPILVFLFYHLARHPSEAKLLRKELSSTGSELDISVLSNLPRLNAFINETLRLFPTTPTGGYRVTPEGLHVGGRFLPGGVTIVAPAYNIGRQSSCFDRPNDFVPDRWLSQTHMVRNKKAFVPFKQGRHSCIGKKLAMVELSVVVALLVSRYDIQFPPGEDGSAVIKDMKDCFTAKPGQLNLVFTEMQKS